MPSHVRCLRCETILKSTKNNGVLSVCPCPKCEKRMRQEGNELGIERGRIKELQGRIGRAMEGHGL